MTTPSFLINLVSAKTLYKKEVKARFKHEAEEKRIVTENDLQKLPLPVATYLRYCGWPGKEIPVRIYGKMHGDFSLKPGKWTKVKVEQYSWLTKPARYFYISNPVIAGFHRMDERGAFMLIKLLGRFKVVDASGPEMNQAELVTYLNDLCLIAPAALITAPVTWETLDSLSVKVTISEYGNTVSANLFFNESGELINFISYDRFSTPDGNNPKNYPWSTPVTQYRQEGDMRVPSNAKAIWHYPEGDHLYAKFIVDKIVFNPATPHF